MCIADKSEMRQKQNQIKQWMKFPYYKAVLSGEGAALLCALYYESFMKTGNAINRLLAGALMFVFFTVINVAAVIDWKEWKIPNMLCGAMAMLAIPACVVMSEISLSERIAGGLVISVPMFLLAWCFRGSFGGGDIKMVAAGGLFLGWKMIGMTAVFAVELAAVYGVILLISGCDRKTRFPMGPFFAIGMLLSIIFS